MSAAALVQIDRVYAGIPPVACKPDCGDCCGPISMTRAEYERIVERLGHTPAGWRCAVLPTQHTESAAQSSTQTRHRPSNLRFE